MQIYKKTFFVFISILISCILISAFIYLITLSSSSQPVSYNSSIIENDLNNNSLLLNHQQKENISNFAYYQIDKAFNQQEDFEPTIPEILDYNYIYISIYKNNNLRCRKKNNHDSYQSNNLKNDLSEAIEKCLKDSRFGGPIKPEEINDIELVINILHDKKTIINSIAKQEIEPGIHAIELIINNKQKAFYNSGTTLIKNFDFKEILERLCEISGQQENCYKNTSNKIVKLGCRRIVS